MAERRKGETDATSDAALVERGRQGDPDAQRALLTALLPTLRAATRTILGRGPDADDATQQAAIDCLRGLPSFRGEGGMNGWARTIGVRAALRHAAARNRHLSALDPADLRAPKADAFAEARLSEGIPGRLERYLGVLPAVQREALLLRHALEYTVPEIAELLGTSVNTIKSRLLGARKDLRRRIRQDQLVARSRRTLGGAG